MTSAELKRWLEKQGCQFGTQRGSHLKVYRKGRISIIPMYGKKELARGLVNAIKKDLGLKE
jgi:mRNA interferase HicA